MGQIKQVTKSEIEDFVLVFTDKFNTKEKAVNAQDFSTRAGINYTPRDIRRIVGHIRKHDLVNPGCIVSNATIGYWYTEDLKTVEKFVNQELDRMSNQYSNIEKLHRRIRKPNKKQEYSQLTVF